MRIRFLTKAMLLCATLLGFAAPCPASGPPAASADSFQQAQSEEAVIVSINQNKVTLQSTSDKDRISTITTDTTTGLKVGDRVKVTGNVLTKAELPAAGETGSSAPAPSGHRM